MNTIYDVERILLTKKDNVTARRWIKEASIKQRILDLHTSVNDYHLTINRPDLIQSLEESIDDYLLNPSFINVYLY
ncbi:hypothetical protein ACSFXN_10135 [Planococcus sp. 1R117A]|uniref:hypothetical protein n=1 Tax=Planococcus sp. 1R117A TaxID=3447020 RepID=UPI003EDC0F45